ncbi:MAG TPA: hypothetical protein PLU72_08445 [Candidatus Ozemobacteraceae bacterium]|nr:hypothetical protein [Candidatus Ozemobacteraceae bacterium]
MMEPTWMISLDIGGTAATGVAVLWPDGPVLELSCPSKNLRAMSSEELATLINTIFTKTYETGDVEEAVWLIGAAGARPEPDRQRWAQAMAGLGLEAAEIVVSRDYEANHAAAFGGEEGILSVNGTGSVLFGRRNGTDRRRGGWGFLLDTSPSGAEFGRLAMQQVLGAIEDNAHGNSILAGFQKQFRHLDIDRAALLDWLYADPAAQRRLGEIAPVLTIAVDEGDRTAEALVSASLRRWASDVRALSGELGFGNRVPLAGVGGLWSRWKAFPERALAVLSEREPGRFTLKQPAFPPAWGPLVRYLAGSPRGLDPDGLRHLRALADKVH